MSEAFLVDVSIYRPVYPTVQTRSLSALCLKQIYFLSLWHINRTAAVHLSTPTNFWVSNDSLSVLCAKPQDCLVKLRAARLPQRQKLNFQHVQFPCDSLAILWGRPTAERQARLLLDTQDVRTTNARARTHRAMNLHLLHGCGENATNHTTGHVGRTTVAWSHLRQSCNFANIGRQPWAWTQDKRARIVRLLCI